MVYLAVGILVLLLAGSAYSHMRSQREAKRRSDLLYNEILCSIDGATFKDKSDIYPSLEGSFENHRIIIVPTVDNLSPRRLPRLYLKVVIYLKSRCQCRILATEDRSYLFAPLGFEEVCFTPDESYPDIRMFMAKEPENKDFGPIINILTQLEACSEVLITENLVRATFLAARGEQSYYRVMRAAVFPAIIFKQQNFVRSMKLLMELRGEVDKLETA